MLSLYFLCIVLLISTTFEIYKKELSIYRTLRRLVDKECNIYRLFTGFIVNVLHSPRLVKNYCRISNKGYKFVSCLPAIKRKACIFKNRVDRPGLNYTQASYAAQKLCFKGKELCNRNKVSNHPLNPGNFK